MSAETAVAVPGSPLRSLSTNSGAQPERSLDGSLQCLNDQAIPADAGRLRSAIDRFQQGYRDARI